ncbi:hypothetical protein OGATHE_001825 [Ogataea polymorpha]|uniref:Uncharacterized protein n=1 Tax=Ogataea polymorpha TaxID=460523 RepID=A0A9P8PLS1_9ASCO|nr:hypothetical protein OGATHE_001825 [Ogataea polymorpha]
MYSLANADPPNKANEPGAFLAAVHPHPLYKPSPSSCKILKKPLPLKASGFVCLLIFSTSRGSRIISPIPIRDPAVADSSALPVLAPKASSYVFLKLVVRNSFAKG